MKTALIFLTILLTSNISFASHIECNVFIRPKVGQTFKSTQTIPDNLVSWETKSNEFQININISHDADLPFKLNISHPDRGDIFFAQFGLGEPTRFEDPDSDFIYEIMCK